MSEEYKPGQRITSMSRARFLELWEGIRDGTLDERWTEGKEPSTRKERVEARQIRAMTLLYMENREKFQALVESDEWNWLEVVVGKDGLMYLRVPRSVVARKGVFGG